MVCRNVAAADSESNKRSPVMHDHIVQFYESEGRLSEAVTRFIEGGLERGNSIVTIATPEHHRAFTRSLRMRGRDLESAIRNGQLTQLDAEETLSKFMPGSVPDEKLFIENIGSIVTTAQTRRKDLAVLAYGEMVDILWRKGQLEAAIRLEELWNDLVRTHSFTLFCAYTINGFYKESHRETFDRIGTMHSNVIHTERYALHLNEEERAREISLLEQRSTALETEMHRRKQVELALLRALDGQRQREDAEAFAASIIESANDAIVTKTLTGIITSWNRGAERLFGYTANEIIGKPVLLLIPPERVDEEKQILGKLGQGDRIEHYETQRLRKDGQLVDVSLTVSPVRNKAGKIIGASKIARDITEQKRFQAERDRLLTSEREARAEAEMARMEAQEANRLKDDFLAVLSHELRTPLNAILGWSSILSSRNDDGSVDRAIEVIQRNAGVQKRLIEDLLDMSRILTGKMMIKSAQVDLNGVVHSAVDSVRPAISAKGIILDLQLEEGARFIIGDADRLHQVLWNLLSNSAKFTPSQGRIGIETKKVNSTIEITVRDSGRGISSDFLPHVFERFRQGDGSTTRSHGGLGLGLAVVRHLVEAHGGLVWATSEGAGKGATFVVSLPIGNQ
jgi:PAS domain S-box-containing protein